MKSPLLLLIIFPQLALATAANCAGWLQANGYTTPAKATDPNVAVWAKQEGRGEPYYQSTTFKAQAKCEVIKYEQWRDTTVSFMGYNSKVPRGCFDAKDFVDAKDLAKLSNPKATGKNFIYSVRFNNEVTFRESQPAAPANEPNYLNDLALNHCKPKEKIETPAAPPVEQAAAVSK